MLNIRQINFDVYMSRVVRKPTFCICENKDADQLRGNREADQRLCFLYKDCTIPLLSKYGGRTGLVVRALDSGSGDPGSILGRVGVLFP